MEREFQKAHFSKAIFIFISITEWKTFIFDNFIFTGFTTEVPDSNSYLD